MNPRPGAHVLAWGGYLAAMALCLGVAGAVSYLALYAFLLSMLVYLTTRRVRAPTARNLRHELAYYPIAMNVCFPVMAGAVPAIRAARYDELLLNLDLRLLGASPNVWAERFVSPVVTEVMSACYLFFMPLLFANLVRYFFWQRELLPEFYRGLFTVYGLGFLGYLCVPAAGPYLAHPGLFHTTLSGGFLAAMNEIMVRMGSNHVDVFPSLHCAVSAYILGFASRHHRREFLWLLLPVTGLWLSTIYLRYHYAVDVVCGFALALAALSLPTRRSAMQSTGGPSCA